MRVCEPLLLDSCFPLGIAEPECNFLKARGRLLPVAGPICITAVQRYAATKVRTLMNGRGFYLDNAINSYWQYSIRALLGYIAILSQSRTHGADRNGRVGYSSIHIKAYLI